MIELKTTIRFFQPFRIVPWIENNRHSDRNYLRGGTFAKWHMIRNNEEKIGKPYITGTLFRSALITEIEKISIHHSELIKCCSAIDVTKNNDTLAFLRKRPLYAIDDKNTPCKKCALCHILGRMDDPNKKKKYDGNHYHNWTVHFSNFQSNSSFFWKDITQKRIVNRVDQTCGKAKDYFTIWEVDTIACPTLSGIIRINDQRLSQEDVVSIKQLIAVALAQMDTLAGGICRIDISSEDHNQLIQNFFRNAPLNVIKPDDTKPGGERFDLANLKKLADLLAKNVDRDQREQQLRRLADAIRDLRRYSPNILAKLPAGKTDGKTTIWDKKVSGTASIRDCLKIQKIPVELWRQFCEGLGKEIHTLSKNDRPNVTPRLLGETNYPGRPFRKDDETDDDRIIINSRALPKIKIIVSGKLIAKTPFFIGHENKSSHTSATILLNPYGQFCIPRSTIRGILRRDLRTVFGDSCNTPVGSKVCFCNVCQVMRCIKIEDAISSYKSAPEVRHRIRLNCHTGVVEEGALFDIEAGYQGMMFPFRLYYESNSDGLPHHLWDVLNNWKNGQAFLGGEAGTGFGRFELSDIAAFQWEIDNDDDYLKYLFSRAYKGKLHEELKDIFAKQDKQTWNNCCVKQTIEPEKIPLTKICYTLSIDSPLISRDPISAMLDERNPDAVMVKKTVLTYDENQEIPKETPKYFIKSESIRGLLRSIISKKKDPETNEKPFNLDHEDCDCIQCRLFGNVHQQGMLRFEDAEVKNDDAIDIKIDHVAIDRFTGGGVEKMKFNDYPLSASPNDVLILNGVIWVSTHMEKKEKEALASALADLKYGYASIGGLSAIGYGQVKDLTITEGSDFIQLSLPNERSIVSNDRILLKPNVQKSLNQSHIYYPHYFIQPKAEKVKRETKLISHAQNTDADDKPLLTGKIKCRLKTLGPLFIPDTSDHHNYFNLPPEENEHKNYGFFRVKDKIAIPGASIRGMISSVYETLTHSCFRVMDDSKYLTRRVIPESETTHARKTGRFQNKKDDENNLLAGRVHFNAEENKWYLTQMGEIVRLPLYDDLSLIETMDKHEYADKCKSYLQGLDKAIKYNRMLAKAADHNRKFLQENDEAEDILNGKKEIYFTLHKQAYRTRRGIDKEINPNARYACLTNQSEGSMKGFIKYTGLDMVTVKKEPDNETPFFDPEWEKESPPKQFVLHNMIELRSSQKKKYPRPVLACIKDGVEYRMQKRCERIITSSEDDPKKLVIPRKVVRQYNTILEDNKNNTENIPKLFQSKMIGNTLSEGDLVYFQYNENTVTELSPVSISRTTDERPMGKRFPKIKINGKMENNDSLRPCSHSCTEDCDECPNLCENVKDYFKPHPEGLCPACHLFGTTYYKSRLNVGMAWLKSDPIWYVKGDASKEGDASKGGMLTLPLLETPRPTWSMPTKESEIPGRKFYVHHPWTLEDIKNRQLNTHKDTIKRTENNRSIEPLGKDNTFTFEIKFNHLRDWELGLLLYSIELESQLAHKMGMAKAFGMGSVIIDIEEILIKDPINEMTKKEFIQKGFKQLGIDNMEADSLSQQHHINQLREILWFTDNGRISVKYPELKNKDTNSKIPAYTDFVREVDLETGRKNPKFLRPKSRLNILQNPWQPWYIDS